MVFTSPMQRTKKGAAAAKTRSLRRAELLLLEAQSDILEHRIQYLEKFPAPPDGRKPKREFDGPPLPDRIDGNKRAKHDGVGSMTLDEMFNQCRKILTQLRKNNNSGPFLAPVDPIALNCPDYFKIVKHPMDFKTITAKLRPAKRLYVSPLDFRDDVRQVFRNCTLYNPIGNQIRIMGDRLSECFETLWTKSGVERYCPARPETQKRGREGEEESGRDKKMKTCSPDEALKKLTAIQTRLQEVFISAGDKMGTDEMEIDQETPLDFWQKRKLNETLESASEGVLGEVGKILSEKEGEEKGEMRMDDMTDAELHRLWSAVQQSTELEVELKEDEDMKTEPVQSADPEPEAVETEEMVLKEEPADEVMEPVKEELPEKSHAVPEISDEAEVDREVLDPTGQEKGVDEALAVASEEPMKESETALPQDKEQDAPLGSPIEATPVDQKQPVEQSERKEAIESVEDLPMAEQASTEKPPGKAPLQDGAPVSDNMNGTNASLLQPQ